MNQFEEMALFSLKRRKTHRNKIYDKKGPYQTHGPLTAISRTITRDTGVIGYGVL